MAATASIREQIMFKIIENDLLSTVDLFSEVGSLCAKMSKTEKDQFLKIMYENVQTKIKNQYNVVLKARIAYVPTLEEINVISDIDFLRRTAFQLTYLSGVCCAYKKICKQHLKTTKMYIKFSFVTEMQNKFNTAICNICKKIYD